MKEETEKMHREETTLRGLRARASAGIGGFAFFGDNVGKIVNPRYLHFKLFPTEGCICGMCLNCFVIFKTSLSLVKMNCSA